MKDEQTHAIIGAAMEVHRELEPGFLEPVYQDALAVELGSRGLEFVRELELSIFYKGAELTRAYRADFVCFSQVIVELKALPAITGVEEAQLINYLKATKLECGLLINFARPSLEFKRYIFSNLRKSAESADAPGTLELAVRHE